MLIKILFLMISVEAFSFNVFKGVEVGGNEKAVVTFLFEPKKQVLPALDVHENVIELNFRSSKFDEKLKEKLDILSPHLLIRRINAFLSSDVLRVNIVINGSVENLRNRLKLENSEKGISLYIDFPEKMDGALKLLKEERVELAKISPEPLKSHRGFKDVALYLSVLFLFFLGGFGFIFFLKKRGRIGGSRKYLVEHMSYCPLGGGKAGVSVIRVGTDFFLIGVTSNQVTFLSTLPKLSTQYEQETSFERSSFREAIEEEYKKIKSSLSKKQFTKNVV